MHDSEPRKSALEAGVPDSRATPAPATGKKSDQAVEPPEVFGRYRITRRLGHGGMGAVYLARDTELDREVALKVPHFAAENKEIIERFYREARAAAGLSHPNICPIYDVGQLDGTFYLTMGYVEGKPLTEFIRPEKPMGQAQAAALVRKIALALDEAHRKGIIHRDLKPANIMINLRKEPVIMDFGLARRTGSDDARITRSGAVVGTPAYMSPEQVGGKDAGPASDIFSLGVILYEMLTAKLPFDGPMMAVLGQILTQEPEPPTKHRLDLEADLAAICKKAMAKKPEERFTNMAEFAAALAQFLRGSSSTATISPIETQAKPALEARVAATPKPAVVTSTKAPAWGEIAKERAAPAAPMHGAKSEVKSLWKKPWPWIGMGGMALLVWLGVTLYYNTGEGTVVIELNDDTADVVVKLNGKEIDILGLGAPIKVSVGKQELIVHGPDYETVTKSFRLRRGGEEVVHVELKPIKIVTPPLPAGEEMSDELVRNGKCDEPDLQGWEIIKGNWQRSNKPNPFFLAGKGAFGVLQQDVDVSRYAVDIDRGTADFQFAGRVNCFDTDRGRMELVFLNRDKARISSGYDTGEVVSKKKWTPYSKTCTAPPGARFVRIILTSTRANRPGNVQNSAYFDDISLKAILRTPPASPSGVAPPAKVEPPPSAKNTPPPGFTALFNGKDLTGWYVESGDAKQWTVEDGAIVARSVDFKARNYLLTTKDFADFSLRLEFMMAPGGGGGVVLRGIDNETIVGNAIDHPVLKLNDPVKFQDYSSGTTHFVKNKQQHTRPSEDLKLSAGAWHSLEITVRGDTCVALLAGKKTVDLRLDPIDTSPFIPGLKRPKGKIGFQAHTGTVRFRNIQIQELPPLIAEPPIVAAPRPNDADTLAFFNGKNLAGWEGLPGYWKVVDGAIIGMQLTAKHQHTFLCSQQTYKDFELKFKIRRKNGIGNSGVQFRSTLTKRDTFKVIGPQMEIDSATFSYPPGSIVTEPAGNPAIKADANAIAKIWTDADFNAMTLRCVGKHVTVIVNGVTVVNGDFPSMPDEGIIAWQLHGAKSPEEITFKDIEFIDLSKKSANAAPAVEPFADFVPLFNGTDLTGWIGQGGKPAAWRVSNGYLEVSPPGQGNIWTKEKFGDFQLHAEFWIPLLPGRKDQGRGNSGIYLQGRYEIQILDSFQNPTKPEQACGALYNQIAPSQNASKPPEQWQSFDITFHAPRVDGKGKVTEKGRLTVVHNDVTVIDNREFDKVGAGGLDANQGTPGPILLQDHGDPVRFRNLRIRPLASAAPAPAAPAPVVKAWQSLFNGKDLTGWKPHPADKAVWVVNKNGILVGSGPRGHLFSARADYENFHFRVEARVNDKGNSGQYFRAQFDSPFPKGYEAQISVAQGDQKTGSLYNFVKIPQQLHKAGEWFTQEVIAQGNHITILVNNKKIVDFRDPLNTYTKGHLALQQNTLAGIVEFRKIEVKELPP